MNSSTSEAQRFPGAFACLARDREAYEKPQHPMCRTAYYALLRSKTFVVPIQQEISTHW